MNSILWCHSSHHVMFPLVVSWLSVLVASLLFTFSLNTVISRPLDINSLLEPPFLEYSRNIITLSQDRLLLLIGDTNQHGWKLHIFSHIKFFSIPTSMMFLPSIQGPTQQHLPFDTIDDFSSDFVFVHLITGIHISLSEDIILIAFEFSSSNLNNQFDQLSLKVFSLLNLQESSTFEFIVENDLMSLHFNEFSLEQDQSIIANITITHNSNQCTTEFPHEVQFNSIVSCSFCISNTGYTNTSSLQIIAKSIELQTNLKHYCSFLKESVPLFLFASDYKLVVRDIIQRSFLEIATPLSGVRSVDYISSTDSKSLFMVLICKENNCEFRVVSVEFDINDLESDMRVVFLSTGDSHSAAVLSDGSVKTWGLASSGRLGHGDTEVQALPKKVESITDAVSVSCGGAHTLVLKNNGQILAFGSNFYGQLGDATTADKNSPVLISNLANIIAVSSALEHSLALRRDGRVYSWGRNYQGTLGRSTSGNIPGFVTGLIQVVTISTGRRHNLVVRSDGSAGSWGEGGSGRLGNGGTTSRQAIQNCGSFSNAVNVSAGNSHSLILLNNGDLYATGSNSFGQLGVISGMVSTPILVPGFKFAAIASGADSNIGILTNGALVVWGANGYSQLGDGTTTIKNTPFVLTQLTGVYLASIWDHALVACTDKTVFGWGRNDAGRIGDGSFVTRKTPVHITYLEF
ncbi:hypothetical protein RCL1_007880 [Eukaryota sp. TZLM3-RCL]